MNSKIVVKSGLIDYIAGLLTLTLILTMTTAGCMLMATTGTTTTMVMLSEWLLELRQFIQF